MRVAAIVLGICALLAPAPAHAFLTAGKTTGTEVALLPLGPGLWQLTVESTESLDLGFQLAIENGASFEPNPAICDAVGTVVICGPVAGSDVDPAYADWLFLIVAVATSGALDGGVGNPTTLGAIRDRGALPQLDDAPCWALDCYDSRPPPVDYVNPVPEPGSAALVTTALLLLGVTARKRRCAMCVFVVALFFAVPAHAFLTPGKTTGTEFALLPLGPGLWQLTIETDGNADAGGLIGMQNLILFEPNTAICDPSYETGAICGRVRGIDLDPALAGSLFIIVAVVESGALNTGVGNPLTLGSVRDTGVLPLFYTEDELDGLLPTTGCCASGSGFPTPVTYVNPIPEPGTLGLLALSLAILWRSVRHRSTEIRLTLSREAAPGCGLRSARAGARDRRSARPPRHPHRAG